MLFNFSVIITSFSVYTVSFFLLYFVIFPKSWMKKSLTKTSQKFTPMTYHKYICSWTSSMVGTLFFFKNYWTRLIETGGWDLQKMFNHLSTLQKAQTPTEPESWIISFYIGYFLYDSIVLYLIRMKDKVQIFHHIFCLAALLLCSGAEVHGFDGPVQFCMLEISSCVLNARGWMKFHSWYLDVEKYVDLAYASLFFSFRIVGHGLLGIFFYFSEFSTLDMVFWWGGLFTMNVVFMKRAAQLVRKSWF